MTAFDVFNTLLMLLVILVTLYPFWYLMVAAFNKGNDFLVNPTYFWPREFTVANFQAILKSKDLWDAFAVTVARTTAGTLLHLLVTGIFAYATTRRELIGRKFYNNFCLVTLFFSGGLIPYYIVVTGLGLYNNFLVYIIPPAMGYFDVIIFRSFFRELPESLVDSAKIDGAGNYRVFFQIVAPLSTPVIAALALFTAVGHWNSFFDTMLFTSDTKLQTMQFYLMTLIKNKSVAAMNAQQLNSFANLVEPVTPISMQMAAMVAVTVPIMLVYPFLQKYFTKGLLLGSIKE